VSDAPRARIVRWERGTEPSSDTDELAGEEPLEIRVGGRAVSVTMRTPGEDAELAVGFLLSEGMIRCAADVSSAAPLTPDASCNVIEVELAPGVAVDFERLTRHVFASSSCGLCGKVTIDSVHQQFPPVESDLTIDAATLVALPDRARAAQTAFHRTGGLHAAAIFDERGELVVLREDVGRHNAVDKTLGYGLMNGRVPFDRHVLLVSGRASFEIMQKALAARVPIVAAVSAPSSLAVEFAAASRQTLVAFVREGRMNVYAGKERIRFAPDEQ
jgi:FdhD protein